MSVRLCARPSPSNQGPFLQHRREQLPTMHNFCRRRGRLIEIVIVEMFVVDGDEDERLKGRRWRSGRGLVPAQPIPSSRPLRPNRASWTRSRVRSSSRNHGRVHGLEPMDLSDHARRGFEGAPLLLSLRLSLLLASLPAPLGYSSMLFLTARRGRSFRGPLDEPAR